MFRNYHSYLFIIIILGLFSSKSFSQKGLKKHIDITVIDGSSGKPIHEAEVIIKGLLKETRTTGTDGVASFDIVLLSNNITLNIEVTDGNIFSGHSKYRGTINLTGKVDNYSQVVTLKSSSKRINVIVVDDKNHRPVAEASVTLSGSHDGKNDVGTTDGNGTAPFDIVLIDKSKTIPISIIKDGFEPFNTSVNVNSKNDQYTVNAILTTDKYSKIIKVSVVDEKGDPVPEASITAEGASFNDFARASTDQAGVASLLVKASGEFTVSLRDGNFEPVAEQRVTVNRLGDKDAYTLTFKLKRKKSKFRNLMVRVFDEKNHTPIANASVDVSSRASDHVGGITDNSGIVHINNVLALGEDGTVTINGEGIESATKSYIGGGENYRYSPPVEDDITIYVKKTNDDDIKLSVLALDKITDKPITNASISVSDNTSVTIATGGSTNSNGEVRFVVSGKNLKHTPFRVKARANGYLEKWSDVTDDFLKSGDVRDKLFTVYLEPLSNSDFSGEWVEPRNPRSTMTISVNASSASGTTTNVKLDDHRIGNQNMEFTDKTELEGKVAGNTITGTWVSHYEDYDKKVVLEGKLKLTLQKDNTLTIEEVEKGPPVSVTWKRPNEATYTFYWAHDGATWIATYKRK